MLMQTYLAALMRPIAPFVSVWRRAVPAGRPNERAAVVDNFSLRSGVTFPIILLQAAAPTPVRESEPPRARCPWKEADGRENIIALSSGGKKKIGQCCCRK